MLNFFKSFKKQTNKSTDKTTSTSSVPAPLSAALQRLGDESVEVIRKSQVSMNTQFNKDTGQLEFSIAKTNFDRFPEVIKEMLNKYSPAASSSDLRRFKLPVGNEEDCKLLTRFINEAVTPPTIRKIDVNSADIKTFEKYREATPESEINSSWTPTARRKPE